MQVVRSRLRLVNCLFTFYDILVMCKLGSNATVMVSQMVREDRNTSLNVCISQTCMEYLYIRCRLWFSTQPYFGCVYEFAAVRFPCLGCYLHEFLTHPANEASSLELSSRLISRSLTLGKSELQLSPRLSITGCQGCQKVRLTEQRPGRSPAACPKFKVIWTGQRRGSRFLDGVPKLTRAIGGRF